MTVVNGLDRATLVDVSLRDGLQDEAVIVPTQDKLVVVEALVAAGVSSIEATSFVHPKWVPQLADAEALVALLPKGPRYSALVLNEQGYRRATKAFAAADFAAGSFDLVFVISASARHAMANNNRTIDESFEIFERVAAAARTEGVALRAVIACAFGSAWPDEVISPRAVRAMAQRFSEGGARTITLADTVGLAQRDHTATVLDAVVGAIPPERLALHLHDRLGVALANVECAVAAGIRTFEGALAGLGGCPFAPDAPGNIDLGGVDAFLRGLGLTTGIDPQRLPAVVAALQAALRDGQPIAPIGAVETHSSGARP
jgi:hydroxymethylglutaryl-CoA lyase